MGLRFISTFSGIEAASVAWGPLGFGAAAFAENDAFCCSLLAQRFPATANLGDIRQADWSGFHGKADIVVGGSPCQAFSVAGRRQGMDDLRGRLMHEYIRCVADVRPQWLVWENVPGVLSSGGGRDFAALLDGLEKCGYALAWRVLDAQFFGVPQRRRRVFVVGHARLECAAEVLFEREGMRRGAAPRRAGGQAPAGCGGRGPGGAGGQVGAYAIQGNVADRAARCNGSGVSEDLCPTLTAADRHVVAFRSRASGTRGHAAAAGVSPTLTTRGDTAAAVLSSGGDTVGALCARDSKGVSSQYVAEGKLVASPPDMAVRRLTPVECERLQGFPDGWTDVEHRGRPASDSARYKALGNSMATPVMRWIGEGIGSAEKHYGRTHNG